MCGRMTQQTDTSEIGRIFRADVMDADPGERYNVAPTQPVTVVLERDSRRVVESHRWGLIPPWATTPAAGSRMINARAETVERSPAFRVPFLRRRCIVPADGFYEWQRLGRVRQPYLIRREDRAPLAFAGLWSLWPDPMSGEWLRSCSVITTEANDAIAELHDRMPVILDADDIATWLDPGRPNPATLRAMLRPAPSDYLELVPVSSRVNDANHEGADLIERVEPPRVAPAAAEPVQATLFG
jgi:putative SOS response-associated peptidase YedK